jgi:hypothetical protein
MLFRSEWHRERQTERHGYNDECSIGRSPAAKGPVRHVRWLKFWAMQNSCKKMQNEMRGLGHHRHEDDVVLCELGRTIKLSSREPVHLSSHGTALTKSARRSPRGPCTQRFRFRTVSSRKLNGVLAGMQEARVLRRETWAPCFVFSCYLLVHFSTCTGVVKAWVLCPLNTLRSSSTFPPRKVSRTLLHLSLRPMSSLFSNLSAPGQSSVNPPGLRSAHSFRHKLRQDPLRRLPVSALSAPTNMMTTSTNSPPNPSLPGDTRQTALLSLLSSVSARQAPHPAHLSRFRPLLAHLVALHPPPPPTMSLKAVFLSNNSWQGKLLLACLVPTLNLPFRSSNPPTLQRLGHLSAATLAPHGFLPYLPAGRIVATSRH